MTKLFALLLVFTTAVVGAPAHLRGLTPPVGFAITSATYSGTGCPPGTAFTVSNSTTAGTTATFSEFYAEDGEGIPDTNVKKTCQISVTMDVPAGHSVGISSVGQLGFISSSAGVKVTHSSVYTFEGVETEAVTRGTLIGPVNNKEMVFRDDYSAEDTIKSLCGQSTVLNLATTLEADASGTSLAGYIAIDSLNVRLQFQTC